MVLLTIGILLIFVRYYNDQVSSEILYAKMRSRSDKESESCLGFCVSRMCLCVMIEYNTITCDEEKNISLTLRRICVNIFSKYSFCGNVIQEQQGKAGFFS